MYREPYRNKELARASVPYQYYTDSYPLMEALKKGTLFPELYRPYRKERGGRR